MSAANSLNAVDPAINATVAASAGSGKTWLLVTRIIRLLLAGARPGSILALTFTRKAAAEMQLRLQQRLEDLAVASPDALDAQLRMMGAATGDSTRRMARMLYEAVMHNDYPVRLQTFHAFCQDILAAFPLEAEVPPGFELREDTLLEVQQAREQLFAESTEQPDGPLATQLDVLMQAANGPANTYSALDSMLDQRNDWWAFTEGQQDPPAQAVLNLREQLGISDDNDPIEHFFTRIPRTSLSEFAALLRKHPTKTNNAHASLIEAALGNDTNDTGCFEQIIAAFLTGSLATRSRKETKPQAKAMGEEGQRRFLSLHAEIAGAIHDCLAARRAVRMLAINSAWFVCGHRYIEHYQQIKQNLRVLDFGDLEWACYRLLKGENNAHWVQFRIDQRIDHMLIDEFQDTNPTQWQLILPLLEEMSAGDPERDRSLFLVGDEKQSIYQFRRANPELQRQASDWLSSHSGARATPLDASRRSSRAIMLAVNAVFGQESIRRHMPGFSLHDTHLDTPGEVWLLPMHDPAGSADDDDQACVDDTSLRNPLLEPRPEPDADHRMQEAERIALLVEERVAARTPVCTGPGASPVRAMHYGDIMILFRNRTHIALYEDALRKRNIPFLGSQRGSLLDNQEIEDMEKLLNCLVTPFNNLDIAQVLKSPVFDASDEDLARLASLRDGDSWYQRLESAANGLAEQHPLQRASRMLHAWHGLAARLPVHDLLDRIYAEGNIIKRYTAAANDSQRTRVAANLQRFHEMSLDHNSGRYPSLSHFLHHLKNIRDHSRARPDEPVQQSDARVSMMTIHASKGLESPMVIIADADSRGSHHNAWTALVDWPADSDRPRRYQLLLDARSTDRSTERALEHREELQQREEYNLLYVAMTRARQYLYISSTKTKQSSGWHQQIRQGMQPVATETENGSLFLRYGTPAQPAAGEKPVTRQVTEPPASLLEDLRATIAVDDASNTISPSRTAPEFPDEIPVESTDGKDGTLRGTVIHRALELISGETTFTADALRNVIGFEMNISTEDDRLDAWLQEASSVHSDPAFSALFDPPPGAVARNEVPVLYETGARMTYGVIDRLVIFEDSILIVDYKTHPVDDDEQITALAARYRDQLMLYRTGVEKMWPGKPVECTLLFTHSKKKASL